MASTPYLYLYTTSLDPPSWRLGTQLYHVIGKTLEYLLETAEVATAALIISILCLCLWKQELRFLPIIGVVGVCFHEWALVFTFVLQVSFILLVLGGAMNFVLWKFFLKGVWGRACRDGGKRWDAGLFVRGGFKRIFGGVARWSCWYEVGAGISPLLHWAACVRFWVAYLSGLPNVYWRKWVSGPWASVWAHISISHFGRKHHEAAEGDEEDFEIRTYIPEPTNAEPIGPVMIRSMHCTGSTLTDYVNPYPSSPPSCDLLLPESYPLPTAIVPDTPTAQQLCDEDPFKTPVPRRAGDPGFLDAYPNPEGGSKWQRGKKSFAEKEMEAWRLARKIEPKAPKVEVKEFRPSPGSEPGFLDAYPCPQPVLTNWLADDVEGNIKQGDSEESDNSKEGNRPHENHSNQPVTTHADGSSTAESSEDASKHQKSGEGAVPSAGAESYQSYLKLMKIVDSNSQGTMEKKAGTEGNNSGMKRKAHAEESQIAYGESGRWDPDKTLSGLSRRWAEKSQVLSWQKQAQTPFDSTPAQKIDAIEARITGPGEGYPEVH